MNFLTIKNTFKPIKYNTKLTLNKISLCLLAFLLLLQKLDINFQHGYLTLKLLGGYSNVTFCLFLFVKADFWTVGTSHIQNKENGLRKRSVPKY
jgi:hypothetical protein